jgi:geranylgeranyl diphosphate synthase type II
VAARCVSELAKAAGACQLVGGQEDDLKAEFTSLGIEQLEAIHRRKTGAMIRVSLRLGGIVGAASDRQLTALDAYGERLGLAFQIVDDLLDQEGTAAALGKRTRKDGEHGKLTFPALLGAEESRRRAEQLVAGAIDAVGVFGPKSDPLVALAKYVVERDH